MNYIADTTDKITRGLNAGAVLVTENGKAYLDHEGKLWPAKYGCAIPVVIHNGLKPYTLPTDPDGVLRYRKGAVDIQAVDIGPPFPTEDYNWAERDRERDIRNAAVKRMERESNAQRGARD